MPKTLKNIFDSKLDFLYFYNAHLRASQKKTNRRDVIAFEIDLETKLMNLCQSIKNGTYHTGKYFEFTIYEPKQRLIKSLPYIDRVVHQWYVEEFILPFIIPKFIKDNYACIRGRGTHKAVDAVQRYMRIMKKKYSHYYILKCDIKKYFYSIDKAILFDIMKHHFSDKKLIQFTKNIIFDDGTDRGIPIGNYTSQFFANIYLNELDHYMKEELSISYYVRYMDDFILMVSTKKEARDLFKKINSFVSNRLKLTLNSKSKYYPNQLGIDFCGYRIYETHRFVRKSSKKKIRKLVKKANSDYENGTLNFNYIRMCYNSWKAHASHANSYSLVRKYHDSFLIADFLD